MDTAALNLDQQRGGISLEGHETSYYETTKKASSMGGGGGEVGVLKEGTIIVKVCVHV